MKYIQSKIKFIALSCLLLIFTGCSGSALKYFDKEDGFVQNVQYTKIMKIVNKNDVKAIATITYLNSADSTKWDNGKQNFIISLYITDKDKDCCVVDLTVLKEKKIQLNETQIEYEEVDVASLEERVIKKSDLLYDTIPLRNNWAEYKLVSYDNKEFEDIDILTFKLREKKEKKNTKRKVFFIKE